MKDASVVVERLPSFSNPPALQPTRSAQSDPEEIDQLVASMKSATDLEERIHLIDLLLSSQAQLTRQK